MRRLLNGAKRNITKGSSKAALAGCLLGVVSSPLVSSATPTSARLAFVMVPFSGANHREDNKKRVKIQKWVKGRPPQAEIFMHFSRWSEE